MPVELQLIDQHISATSQDMQNIMLKQDRSPGKVPALNFNKIGEMEFDNQEQEYYEEEDEQQMESYGEE